MRVSKFQLVLFIQFLFAINAFSQLNASVYISGARGAMAGKNYFEAIQKLDVCIKIKPSEYEAYFLRGVCKYFLNDDIGAEQDLNVAINMYDPYLYEAFHYRSFVKYRLGKYDEAIKDITEVMRSDNKALLYVERAFSKLANLDYNGSIDDCNTALKRGLLIDNLYMCRGMCENALTQFDSALIDYNRALKLNPKNIDVYVRIGITYAGLTKYKEAIEQYDIALKFDTACTLAYYNRAEANVKINDYKAAMHDYNMVIKYDPMNALAYFNRAALEADQTNYAAAINDFNEVLVLNPKNIQALFNRAKLKTATNDYHGALADYDKIIDLFPYFVEGYYYRAKLKETLHDISGAKMDYNTGKMMSILNHSIDKTQRVSDSNKLTQLTALKADFSNENEKQADTVRIDVFPIYGIVLKSSNHLKAGYFPILLKKSKKEYTDFLLTNKDDGTSVSSGRMDSLKDTKHNDLTADVTLQRAIEETNLQLFNDAIEDYNKTTELDTGMAVAYFARGVDLCREIEMLGRFTDDGQYTLINNTYHVVTDQKNEKYKKALSDFSKVISMEPEFSYAYYNRAYIKYKLQDFSGAIDDYNMALQIDDDFADAYYNRGLLLFCLHDNLNACKDFSKAGELGVTEAYAVIKRYCDQVVK